MFCTKNIETLHCDNAIRYMCISEWVRVYLQFTNHILCKSSNSLHFFQIRKKYQLFVVLSAFYSGPVSKNYNQFKIH